MKVTGKLEGVDGEVVRQRGRRVVAKMMVGDKSRQTRRVGCKRRAFALICKRT